MIEELSELTSTVNRHKISHLALLDTGFLKDTHNSITQLYNCIANNNNITDAEAKLLVYGAAEDTDVRYRKLKSRLKQRLLNTVFIIDNEEKGGYTEYQKAYINCHKNWALVRLLQAYGCRATFISLAKELIIVAQKWQFTDITLVTAQVLSTAIAFNGNKKEQSAYRSIAEKASLQYLDEMQCQMDFDEMTALLNYHKGVPANILPSIINIQKSINIVTLKYPHVFRMQLLEKRIAFVVAELKGDINNIIDSCEAVEDLIHTMPDFYQPSFHAEFVLNHMLCYLRLKNYAEGIAYYKKTLNLIKHESGHYLTLQYYYILSLIHAGRYEEAAFHFNTSTVHTLFKSQPRLNLVRWRLIEAALNYIFKEGYIKKAKIRSLQGKAFNMLKLLNDIGSFVEDKAGINMVLHILNVAFLIQDEKFKKVMSLQSKLYTYKYRYLHSSNNQSAFLFMRMLYLLIKAGYDVTVASDKIQDAYKKLETIPPSLAQDVSIDVLPYTWLWQTIKQHCEKYGYQ